MYKILGGDQKEYGPVTLEQLREWVAQQRVNGQTLILAVGGTEWKPLNTFPELAALSSPPAYGTATVAATADNPMSVVVPYKNPKALIAYYCAIFSLIPCLGLPLGITAFVLGLLGLKAANAHPSAHGKVHAWVGIILGGLCGVGNLAAIVLMIVGAANSR
jgi:hypothetical protein